MNTNTTKHRVAALGMYDFPEARHATDRFWKLVADRCRRNGLIVSSQLCRSDSFEMSSAAKSGELIFAQTCGWPMIFDPAAFQIVGVPTYSCVGCEGTSIRSLIVVKETTTIESLVDMLGVTIAINGRSSMTGCLLLAATLGKRIMESAKIRYTGAHANSIAAVVCGTADAAAIDPVTFAMISKYRPLAVKGLKVLDLTCSGLSLPYVTSCQTSPADLQILRTAIQETLDADGCFLEEELFLTGIKFDHPTVEEYKSMLTSIQKIASMKYKQAEHVLDNITTEEVDECLCLRANLPKDSVFAELLIACIRSDLSLQEETCPVGETKTSSLWRTLPDDRSVRLVYPSGRQAAAIFFRRLGGVDLPSVITSSGLSGEGSSCLPTPVKPAQRYGAQSTVANAVCFLGNRPPVHACPADDHEAVGLCWSLDAALVDRLDPAIVVAYATGEVEPGGEWGNVVLFQYGKSADDFRADGDPTLRSTHQYASETVAARYYSQVRIHRCTYDVLNGAVGIRRTLHVRYPPLLCDVDAAADQKTLRRIVEWGEPAGRSNAEQQQPQEQQSGPNEATGNSGSVGAVEGSKRVVVESPMTPKSFPWRYDGLIDSLESAYLESLVNFDGTLIDADRVELPEGYAYASTGTGPSSGSVPRAGSDVGPGPAHFDEAVHLDLPLVPTGLVASSMSELGYTSAEVAQLPTAMAQSNSFQVLSQAGLAALRAELERLRPHIQTSPRIPKLLRGTAYRSRFVYDLCTSPKLLAFLSALAGCAIIPHPMGIMHGHTNMLPDGDRRGENIDKWHRDTVTFVLIIFITPEEQYDGGKFEFFRGTVAEAEQILQQDNKTLPGDRVANVGSQRPGYGVFQQGWRVYHRAQAVSARSEARTTFVLSFVAADARTADSCTRLSQTYNEIDPLHVLLPDWARYRCWKAQRLLMYFLRATYSMEEFRIGATDGVTAGATVGDAAADADTVSRESGFPQQEAEASHGKEEEEGIWHGPVKAGDESKRRRRDFAEVRLSVLDSRQKLLRLCAGLAFTANRVQIAAEMSAAVQQLKAVLDLLEIPTPSVLETGEGSAATAAREGLDTECSIADDEATTRGSLQFEAKRHVQVDIELVDLLVGAISTIESAVSDVRSLVNGSSTMKAF